MVNIMLHGKDTKAVTKKGVNNMFIKGDKIVVVNNKADTTRLKNGMTGTILDITTHFVIVKLEDIIINLMFAPAEFFETFDKVKKREWSEWKYSHYICEYYSAVTNSIHANRVWVRNNGKTVQVRYCYAGEYVTSEAKCSKYDEFDLNIGIEIALARLSQKLTQSTLEKRIENME